MSDDPRKMGRKTLGTSSETTLTPFRWVEQRFNTMTPTEKFASLGLGLWCGYNTWKFRSGFANFTGAYAPYYEIVKQVTKSGATMPPRSTTIAGLEALAPLIDRSISYLPVFKPPTATQGFFAVINPSPAPFIRPRPLDMIQGARAMYCMTFVSQREFLGLMTQCGVPQEPVFVKRVAELFAFRSQVLNNAMRGAGAATAAQLIIPNPIPTIAGYLNAANSLNFALNFTGQATNEALAFASRFNPDAERIFIDFTKKHFFRYSRPYTPAMLLGAVFCGYAYFAVQARNYAVERVAMQRKIERD